MRLGLRRPLAYLFVTGLLCAVGAPAADARPRPEHTGCKGECRKTEHKCAGECEKTNGGCAHQCGCAVAHSCTEGQRNCLGLCAARMNGCFNACRAVYARCASKC